MYSSASVASGSKHNPKLKLKPSPPSLPSLTLGCRSDEIHPSPGGVPPGSDIRQFYLSRVGSSDAAAESFVPPPLISASPFVPASLIRFLMREKKDSALGVKYSHGDRITNMEGAMHTFVTPVIGRCEMIGDYKYEYGHGVERLGTGVYFKSQKKVMKTRSVALSASIQPDFETPRVMLAVAKLDGSEVVGKDLLENRKEGDLPFQTSSVQDKKDWEMRAAYDAELRAHMVFHLMSSHRLPARKDILNPMSVQETITFLESIITSKNNVAEQFNDKFMETLNDQAVSLELLYNSSVQQVINEFSALEAMFTQGYVYTYDPAVIFAREIGSPILNRLFLAAIKAVSNHNSFVNMRMFAINDFADKKLVGLLESAMSGQLSHRERTVRCCAKSELFKGKNGLYGGEEPGAVLVVHNNSDGFGQNIETEGIGGSLDGAIGASSSAAASLDRRRLDLLDFIF